LKKQTKGGGPAKPGGKQGKRYAISRPLKCRIGETGCLRGPLGEGKESRPWAWGFLSDAYWKNKFKGFFGKKGGGGVIRVHGLNM